MVTFNYLVIHSPLHTNKFGDEILQSLLGTYKYFHRMTFNYLVIHSSSIYKFVSPGYTLQNDVLFSKLCHAKNLFKWTTIKCLITSRQRFKSLLYPWTLGATVLDWSSAHQIKAIHSTLSPIILLIMGKHDVVNHDVTQSMNNNLPCRSIILYDTLLTTNKWHSQEIFVTHSTTGWR
jgi:hypothetical protein